MPPSAATATTGQYTQFLNTVLSQRGPSALPYEEDQKWHIRKHLVSLMQAFPTLILKTAIFNHNDGTTANLLQAEGTIPMMYQQVTYNIPVTIWLLEHYSKLPPLVYLTPTRDMVIKRGHAFVDPSGLVSSPYLKAWVFPSSNLVDMVKNLSILFGQNPPLFTRQRATQNQNNHGGVVSHNTHNSLTLNSRDDSPHDDQFKKNAIMNKLVASFHNDMTELSKSMEVEMEGLFSIQGVLRQRAEEVEKGVGELQQEKEDLEQQLQSILICNDVLETWLKKNESTYSNSDIDHVCQPCDVLSKQMLESTAADSAIEDILYSLDKAVQDGAIPVEAYLKNVRTLSREQFFHRALSTKVSEAQLQGQIANMAARAGTFGN